MRNGDGRKDKGEMEMGERTKEKWRWEKEKEKEKTSRQEYHSRKSLFYYFVFGGCNLNCVKACS